MGAAVPSPVRYLGGRWSAGGFGTACPRGVGATITRRRGTGETAEHPIEIIDIRIAAATGDVSGFSPGIKQQTGGVADPQVVQVIKDGRPSILFEAAAEITPG